LMFCKPDGSQLMQRDSETQSAPHPEKQFSNSQ
jgi:hypothetical protein